MGAIQRLGHVVLKMRDLEEAKRFYGGVLGMQITDEREGFGVFFRFSDYHHDIAIFKVSEDAAAPLGDQVGLSHVAMVVDSLDDVRGWYQRLKEHNVAIVRTTDHGVTRSVYFKDPEGNDLEIYCDNPDFNYFENSIIRGDPLKLD